MIPALLAIPLLFLPVFIINMVGQDVVINIMKALPTFVTHGLEVAGGVLPALGFALIMNMIGKNKLIPFLNWLRMIRVIQLVLLMRSLLFIHS